MEKIIETKYVMKKILFNKQSLMNFIVNEFGRRKIRNGQVKTIVNHLKTQKHFSSPLVVNSIDGLMKIIDGNHRFDAIKVLIDENPNFEINVWVAVYSNLNDKEEKEVYREWNIGIKQSATDFLKAHWKTIPMRVRLLDELPVSIYGDKKQLGIKAFVGNQIMAKRQKQKFEGGYAGGIFQVVADFQQLDIDDIDTLVEFSKFIKEVLGKYESKIVKFYTTTAICSVYRIWYDNKDRISPEKMVIAFKKVLNKSNDLLVDASKAGGRGATLNFYQDLINRLNRYSTKFLNDVEVYKIRKKQQKQKQDETKILELITN